MLNSLKKNEELYVNARKLVTNLHEKILKILKAGDNIEIGNAEYMPCYCAVIKACDSCAEPSSSYKDDKLTNNEDRLFNWFKELVKEYLYVDTQELNQIVDSNQYILSVFNQYKNFQIYLHWISRLFYQLDSFFLKCKNSTLHIEGFKLYRDDYFQIINPKLFSHIVSFLKMAIGEQSIPRETIKKIIAIYQVVGFKKTVKLKKINSEFIFEIDNGTKYYEDNFQSKIVDQMVLYFYEKISEQSNLSAPEFVELALQSILKIEEMAEYLYQNSLKDIIINRIEKDIFLQKIEILNYYEQIDRYFMFKEKNKNETKNFYQLFKRDAETLEHIAQNLKEYITLQGDSFNEHCESSNKKGQTQSNLKFTIESIFIQYYLKEEIVIEYFQKVFQLKKESDHVMQYAFNQDITIIKERDNAFLTFLNKNDKSTQMLVAYADIILKQESLQNEQEIEDRVQGIVGIFVYLYSRDTFMKYFQKLFCNHLLNSTSRNKEVEKCLITKFKTESGYTCTNKIETMLKDIKNSEEFNQNNRSNISHLSVEMNVNVLTAGSWPITNTKEKCSAPQILKSSIEQFEKLFKNKCKGRTINWVYSQGTAEIQFKGKEKYFLIVNTYQMVALLTIQYEGSSLNYSKLLEISGIPETELEFILMPFIKLKILNKSDEGDKISNNSDLSVNTQFTNKLKKIKCIPGGKQAQLKKQKEDENGRIQFTSEVNREREFIVDAYIVRIMKSRKQIKVNELFPEVIKLINSFKPEITLIKKRIESLLERDYLERDRQDMQINLNQSQMIIYLLYFIIIIEIL